MDNFKNLHNKQDDFIKKTLQEDKIVSQPIFDKFSISMNKSKVKIKKYSYKQKNIITLLLLLLIISVGFNFYLIVVKDSPISFINIFKPTQNYSSSNDFSNSEIPPPNEQENVSENIIDNTIEDIENNAETNSILIENTVSTDNTNTTTNNKPLNIKVEKVEKPTQPKDFKEINNEQIKTFVDQFAIGINKLDLQDHNNLESNTILLYIAQQYFTKHSNASGSLTVNTDYASSNTNVHKFLNEFTSNDYSTIDYLKSYNNYIGYIPRSKAYVYGNDYSILSKEVYKCDSVTITNKENDIYTAVANVSRTYEEEKNGYEITFTFKINNNYKYQKYKLLSFNSKLVSGDVETTIRLIGN